jgi:hypothetical protein
MNDTLKKYTDGWSEVPFRVWLEYQAWLQQEEAATPLRARIQIFKILHGLSDNELETITPTNFQSHKMEQFDGPPAKVEPMQEFAYNGTVYKVDTPTQFSVMQWDAAERLARQIGDDITKLLPAQLATMVYVEGEEEYTHERRQKYESLIPELPATVGYTLYSFFLDAVGISKAYTAAYLEYLNRLETLATTIAELNESSNSQPGPSGSSTTSQKTLANRVRQYGKKTLWTFFKRLNGFLTTCANAN